MARETLSVIVSTYNQPKWLAHCLTGFAAQSFRGFEIVVADDGSSEETRRTIEALREQLRLRIKHLWQKDEGFRKCTILNRAIEASASDYLVFTDGDCVPRKDFLAAHMHRRQKRRFLSGGYVKLSDAISHRLDRETILDGRHADLDWLRANGFKGWRKGLKLIEPGIASRMLDRLSPANASWNGHNSSGWKADIEAVNGFDERMQYGGEDRELGERLQNAGIRGKRIRFSAPVVHLFHDHSYVKPDMIVANRAIRRETRRWRSTWTDFGLRHSASLETAGSESFASSLT